MKNWGGHFTPELGGQFELESGGHFKLELGGQYHRNMQSNKEISSNAMVKNKVPRKTAGLLPENGGTKLAISWRTTEILLERKLY